MFSVLFPSDCRICQSRLTNISNLPVCQACLLQIASLEGTLCSVCGERIPGHYFTVDGEPQCGSCRLSHPPFRKAVAFGAYDGVLRDLIHLLKYQGIRSAASRLARLLGEASRGIPAQKSLLVVPVPLWPGKRRARGFNQAEDIARAFCRSASIDGIQLCTTLLVRRRETASQTGLTRRQRQSNLRGAFAVVKPQQARGKSVLLIDDVMTTGATAAECARVLLRAGAKQVDVATVARATQQAEGLLRLEAVARQAVSAPTASGMKIEPSGGLPGHA